MKLAACILVVCLPGCAVVSSAQPGSTAVTGEAWYTTTKHFMGLPVGGDIYYCPDTQPGYCQRAEIREATGAPPPPPADEPIEPPPSGE